MKIIKWGFFGFLGLMVFFYVLGGIAKQTEKTAAAPKTPEPVQSMAPEDPAIQRARENERFDLVDMLPARAANLAIISATTFKGRGALHLEPKNQQAYGYYQWARDPGETSDHAIVTPKMNPPPDATVRCYRDDPEATNFACFGEGSKKIKVGDSAACYFAPERPCRGKFGGASISWPGCTIDFNCEGFGKRKARDATDVAVAVERWASWFRGHRETIGESDVSANRAALAEAVSDYVER